MRLSGRHIRALKFPLALLLIVAVSGAGAVSWTRTQIQRHERDLAAQERQLADARNRFQRSGEERDLIARFLPQYKELRARGLVGPEERIGWLEALRAANDRARMFGAEYQIGTQQPYAYAQEFGNPRLGMAQSLMKLSLRLAHEGELMRFLRLLAEQHAGAFDVNQCVLQRTAGGSERVVLQPNLRAECELAWITLNPAPADHKP